MLAVEEVVNIYDTNILWFRIPGFPGYEISNVNLVRSFKSRKKHPFGTLVKWDKNSITLSNNNNIRVKLTLKEIWDTVNSQSITPVHTTEVQNTSRNPMCCIDTNAEVKVGKVTAKPKIVSKKETSFVDFSNIPDIDLNNFI